MHVHRAIPGYSETLQSFCRQERTSRKRIGAIFVQSFGTFLFQDVFACMIKNLFEEYRFFPQYPEKELYTTALLFGGIIREELVGYGIFLT